MSCDEPGAVALFMRESIIIKDSFNWQLWTMLLISEVNFIVAI